MSGLSRREFVTALAALPALPLARQEPELVLHKARIYTMNPAQPEAEALAVQGGRILAIGANADVLALATARTRKIDLAGARVLPGFNDAHCHPCEGGMEQLRNVACDKNTIEDIQAALRARARDAPEGAWVLGFLYDDGKTPRPLSRADLDAAVPGHPVRVGHRGGHVAFVNSRAFALAGIDEHTPDPPGGRYERDANGHLTGLVADAATERIDALLPVPGRADYAQGARLISRQYARNGITSVCDADATHQIIQGYQDAREAGELDFRVYCHVNAKDFPHLLAAGIHTGFGDEWLRIGGVKQYADGSISERTAWLSSPYLGMAAGYNGLALGTRESLYETAKRAWDGGWQLATHANGDLAIDRILDVYEQLMREAPRRDARLRIEHCTLIDADLIRRMRALGVVPVPFSGYVYFHGDVLHFYGEERARHMFAMRSLLEAGLRPAASSDYTASPAEPFLWLTSMVTRTDPAGRVWGSNQRITVAEALKVATLNGAYASFEEHQKGSLEPGKLADLVVLSGDPLKTADPGALIELKVERTMLGGRFVYEA
jgi:predicted amidohydrolase YtcJ